MLRSLMAVLAGTLALPLVVAGVEGMGHLAYPPPAGIESMNWDEMRQAFAGLPAAAFAFVFAAWMAGALCGSWLSAWIAGRAPFVHGGIVGGLGLAATVANLVMLPHPLWLAIAGPAGVVLATLAGILAASRRPARAP